MKSQPWLLAINRLSESAYEVATDYGSQSGEPIGDAELAAKHERELRQAIRQFQRVDKNSGN